MKRRVVRLPKGGGAGSLLGRTGGEGDPHMGVGGGVKEAEPTTVCVGKVLMLTTEMKVILKDEEGDIEAR